MAYAYKHFKQAFKVAVFFRLTDGVRISFCFFCHPKRFGHGCGLCDQHHRLIDEKGEGKKEVVVTMMAVGGGGGGGGKRGWIRHLLSSRSHFKATNKSKAGLSYCL
jgi:hypothetical protein